MLTITLAALPGLNGAKSSIWYCSPCSHTLSHPDLTLIGIRHADGINFVPMQRISNFDIELIFLYFVSSNVIDIFVTFYFFYLRKSKTLHWRHNDHESVSNHQPQDCLLNGLFRRRSKKTSKLRVTGLRVGNSPGPVNSPHKGPVTQKMFPFDDVIMKLTSLH